MIYRLEHSNTRRYMICLLRCYSVVGTIHVAVASPAHFAGPRNGLVKSLVDRLYTFLHHSSRRYWVLTFRAGDTVTSHQETTPSENCRTSPLPCRLYTFVHYVRTLYDPSFLPPILLHSKILLRAEKIPRPNTLLIVANDHKKFQPPMSTPFFCGASNVFSLWNFLRKCVLFQKFWHQQDILMMVQAN